MFKRNYYYDWTKYVFYSLVAIMIALVIFGCVGLL